MDAERCRAILAACLPTLAVEDARYLAEGWDSAVFLVNGDLLFRFPKRREVAVTLERELQLLPELGPALPAPIPSFLYRVQDCDGYPWTFAGYHRIEGRPADEVDLSQQQKVALAAQVGRFLRALHSFPVDRATMLGVERATVAGGHDQWRWWVGEVERQVAPLLSPAEAARLRAWFETAEARGARDFTPALIHNDLGAEHLIVDPDSGALAGVIDWGDVGIGDPAIDFSGLLGGFGAEAARAALAAYGRPDDDALLWRAQLYVDMSPLHEVNYGRVTANDAHIERGLARLRSGLLGGMRDEG